MNDTPVIEKVAKELGLSTLLPEAYRDILQPAAKEFGEQLVVVAKTVGIALSPLRASVWGFEQIQNYLFSKVSAKLAGKNPENIKTPELLIAGPTISGIAYAAEEESLREMYANLLANNMDSSTRGLTHPSFVHIIQQLSPLDARILKLISEEFEQAQIICWEIWKNGNQIFPEDQPSWFDRWEEWNLPIEEGQSVVDNLLRLRIVGESIEVESKYHKGGADERGTWEASLEQLESKVFFVTDYGSMFLKACVK